MFTSKQFCAKAAEYGKLAKGAGEPGAMRDYQKQERNFTELANNKIGWPAAGLHWRLSSLTALDRPLAGSVGGLFIRLTALLNSHNPEDSGMIKPPRRDEELLLPLLRASRRG